MSVAYTPTEFHAFVCRTVKESLEGYVKTLPHIDLDTEEWFYQTSRRSYVQFYVYYMKDLKEELELLTTVLKREIDVLVSTGNTTIGCITVQLVDQCPEQLYFRYKCEICHI